MIKDQAICINVIILSKKRKFEQGPVSTMQETDSTNYSSFLVWSGLEKSFTFGCDRSQGALNSHLCVLGHFQHGDTQPKKQTNEQPGVPSESLILTKSEKAGCCNSVLLWFESVQDFMLPGKEAKGVSSKTICYFFLKKQMMEKWMLPITV